LIVRSTSTFFAADEASTLFKADMDTAAAGKLLVEGASESGVIGHSVVGTTAVATGTSGEVGIQAAESAAVVEAKVGTATVKTGTGTSIEVRIWTAELAAAVEAELGAAAVEPVTGTSREMGIGAAGSVAAADAEGGVIREGDVNADGKVFNTGIVDSAESTSGIGPTTSDLERIGLNGDG
jgi:hypothetical protein